MQEMPDAWTISLICHNYYPYHAGRYVLVSVRDSAETLRAYTISSTPGVSKCITLAVWRTDDDVGSQWLTCDVKYGDYFQFSDVVGEFTCNDKAKDKFLLLAVGYGVTPIMSMRRWLAKNHPQVDVQVICSVHTPQDIIFADEWRNHPATLAAENNVTEGFIAGYLTHELLVGVPDLAPRIVMTCGPAPYTDWVEQEVKALGVTCFFKEKFFTPIAETATSGLKFIRLQSAQEFHAPAGTMLLEALENNNAPVIAACHAGVCDCCKTKVVSGEYTMSSTMTLTDAEIAEGYAPACSCHPQGGLVLT